MFFPWSKKNVERMHAPIDRVSTVWIREGSSGRITDYSSKGARKYRLSSHLLERAEEIKESILQHRAFKLNERHESVDSRNESANDGLTDDLRLLIDALMQ
jgi:hypothetical protein